MASSSASSKQKELNNRDNIINQVFYHEFRYLPILEAVFLFCIGIGLTTFFKSVSTKAIIFCFTWFGIIIIFILHYENKKLYKQRWLILLYDHYSLSQNGFLPSRSLSLLPQEFAILENINKQLPHFNHFHSNSNMKNNKITKSGLYEAIDKMKPLSPELIVSLSSDIYKLRRAYVLLSQIIHSYVHGHKSIWKHQQNQHEKDTSSISVIENNESSSICNQQDSHNKEECEDENIVIIPGQIAVPFHYVCSQLGLPPVITSAGTDLWNWQLINESKENSGKDQCPITPEDLSVSNMKNVTLLSTVTGLEAERMFHVVPTLMQVTTYITICFSLITLN